LFEDKLVVSGNKVTNNNSESHITEFKNSGKGSAFCMFYPELSGWIATYITINNV
jgi:hypothetical protein